MGRFQDLTGQKFGKLTVLERADDYIYKGKNGNKKYVQWLCQCECGNQTVVRAFELKNGHTSSCGCEKKRVVTERIVKHNTIHGQTGTRIYNIWSGMKKRCNNNNSDAYHNYGGRGIKVCKEWNDSFEAFYIWAIENGYNDNLSIDRIDVDKGYYPENCRWADRVTQANNTRANHYIEFHGKTQTIEMWNKELGFPHGLVGRRLRKGWDVERALTEPVHTEFVSR